MCLGYENVEDGSSYRLGVKISQLSQQNEAFTKRAFPIPLSPTFSYGIPLLKRKKKIWTFGQLDIRRTGSVCGWTASVCEVKHWFVPD